MKNLLRFMLVTALTLASMPRFAIADTPNPCDALNSGTGTAGRANHIFIDNSHPPEATTINAKVVTVCRINIFRYGASVQLQNTSSAAPTLPSQIVGSGAGMTPLIGAAAAPLAAPGGSTPPAAPMHDLNVPVAKTSADDEVQQFLDHVTAVLKSAEDLSVGFQSDQVLANQKVSCYNLLLNQYSAVLLSKEDQAALIQSLKKADGCTAPGPDGWGDSRTQKVKNAIDTLIALNGQITEFELGKDYSTWLAEPGVNSDARKALFPSLLTTDAATLTTLTGLLSPTAIGTYNTAVNAGATWDGRAAAALKSDAPWNQTLTIQGRIEWFGKTAGQIISLPYTDYAQATPAPASTPAFSFTNSSLPSLTVSSGLGISTVRNSTYGFEPQTNFAVTPSVTTQVIGYATDSRITPFYVAQLNYSYVHPEHSIGLHISGGAGVGTSTSGTTGDLFVGNAFSFFHRAIFVTPSAHFTQRQELMSGYAVGDPQGSLTSVPTITNWKTGFAITITFPLLQ
jgi:hypothetical protein